jgi:NTP pyrophosphatase (non-canonical NTP hydrolase)
MKFVKPQYARLMEKKSALEQLREFVAERDWAQFHTPENLAKGVSIEAAELLECFQWGPDADLDDVRDELADVLTYCFLLADKYGLDPETVILEKLESTKAKYPVEKSRGKSTKYDEL